MIKDNNVIDEVILLVIIYNHNNLINEVQINQNMFLNKNNKDIFIAMKKVYEKNKSIDIESISHEIEPIIDYFALEIAANDYYVDVNYENQFISCQKRILDNYKIRLYEQLSKQVASKVISVEEYNNKIDRINQFNIINKINYLTEKELLNNIYVKNKGIKFTKFPVLERTLKLFQNDLLVIGASTGVGKSGFMLNLMNDLSTNYQCIYFNIEMAKSTIYRRLLAINQSIPINSIDSPSEYQSELIKKGLKEIENKKIIIENQINNIQDLKVIISKAKDKNKHTIIFIDHIGLLKTNNSKSLYEQLTQIAKELRNICFDYDCTIIAASQLNRSSYSEENPTINMLKDSGELENSSRKVIILYRDSKCSKEDLEPIMKVSIQKNDTGIIGNINMKYYKISQVFKEESSWKNQ